MTVRDDLATLRRRITNYASVAQDHEGLAALARVEAEIARLERQTDMIDLYEFTKRRAEERAEAAEAENARLRDGLRRIAEIPTGAVDDGMHPRDIARALLAEDGAA